MRVLAEFREFAIKGSVVELAVGIIIGAAFGAIVKSLVDDILMPLLGLATGGVDFTDRYWVLRGGAQLAGNETVAQARASGAVVMAYGHFLNNVLTFILVAWAVFLLVKAVNRTRRRKEPAEASTRDCPDCLSKIPKAARRCPQCTASLT